MADMLTRLAQLPYVQAAGDGGPRSRTQLIVIHATDNTASDTAEASYATHRPDQTSCHVVVDEDSAVQINMLDHVAFGCFPIGNACSIQFELCGLSNQLTQTTIARAAQLVAVVAQSWGIPAVRPSVDQMRAGAKGIVGHVDVTNAWHQGDHTDPGASFPWADFLRQVRAAMTNQPSEDDDMGMHLVATADNASIYVASGALAPSGRMAAYGLTPADWQAYLAMGLKTVTLPNGAQLARLYDTSPQAWPVGSAGGSVDTAPILAAVAAAHAETEQVRDVLTAAGRALAG